MKGGWEGGVIWVVGRVLKPIKIEFLSIGENEI